MSTRKSSRTGGEATRENGWGNRPRDQNGGRGGEEGACGARRPHLRHPNGTSLHSFLEKHWQFMCKGQKNKFINSSILNT